MLVLDWSDEADSDLEDIESYIAQFNPAAANRVVEIILGGAERLLSMPYGFRSGRVAGTREYSVHPSYFLVYEVDLTTVTILRVMHAKRLYP